MEPSTRDKILNATTELLWQQSYGAVSVDDICKQAKVLKGSFYHYFPSKAEVVAQALERHWENSRPFYDEIFSASVPPLARLRNFCDAAYQKQKEKAQIHGKVLGCPYMSCGSELSTQEEGIRVKMDELFARATRYFEILLRDAKAQGVAAVKNPAVTAQEMQCYIAGVMYQAKIKNDVEVIRRDLLPGLMRFLEEGHMKTKTERKTLVAS